jgi:hypothetical protein
VPLKNSPRGARDGPNPKDIRYTVFNRIERKTKNLSERVREHRSTVGLLRGFINLFKDFKFQESTIAIFY